MEDHKLRFVYKVTNQQSSLTCRRPHSRWGKSQFKSLVCETLVWSPDMTIYLHRNNLKIGLENKKMIHKSADYYDI